MRGGWGHRKVGADPRFRRPRRAGAAVSLRGLVGLPGTPTRHRSRSTPSLSRGNAVPRGSCGTPPTRGSARTTRLSMRSRRSSGTRITHHLAIRAPRAGRAAKAQPGANTRPVAAHARRQMAMTRWLALPGCASEEHADNRCCGQHGLDTLPDSAAGGRARSRRSPRRLAKESQSTGLWGYLASRDENKSRIELERTRTAGTRELIQHLPAGAILREGTSDGWREIHMPSVPLPQVPFFVLPTEPHKLTEDRQEVHGVPQSPMVLSQGEESTCSDDSS